ncbi:MAG TPA: hypothetical protein DEP18_00670 [Flavobacteriales bacterium]|nr:hypothetical protein [Flavobacteriales bacterium]HRE74216.1 tetratricopeptide repeat protein [Flavobacteriales bacterium]HRE95722.1 tetratricopeptide repeat protein [Flavobacteriales bacterium]HRJ38225.1 tetratricopeptide repeat protein [Flavobacteriales bacterium]
MKSSFSKVHQGIILLVAFLLMGFLMSAPRTLPDKSFEGMNPEQAAVVLALNYMGGGNGPMKGIKMLDKITELHPENTIAVGRLAEFSIQTGQYEKAVGRFEALVAATAGREQVEALMGLSDAAFLAGDTTKCLDALQRVLAMSEDSLLLQSVQKKINELR